MSTADAHALSAAYALEALDHEERTLAEEHIAACGDCADEVARLSRAATSLAAMVAEPPPTGLRNSVLAAISVTRQLPPLVAPRASGSDVTAPPSSRTGDRDHPAGTAVRPGTSGWSDDEPTVSGRTGEGLPPDEERTVDGRIAAEPIIGGPLDEGRPGGGQRVGGHAVGGQPGRGRPGENWSDAETHSPLAGTDAQRLRGRRAAGRGAVPRDRSGRSRRTADRAGGGWPSVPARLFGAVAVAAVVACGALGAIAFDQHRQLEAARSRVADARALAASALNVADAQSLAGGGKLSTASAGNMAIVSARDLPPLGAGKVYQLWLLGPTGPRSAGLIDGRAGSAEWMISNIKNARKVALTVEPKGGSPAPTTEPLGSNVLKS